MERSTVRDDKHAKAWLLALQLIFLLVSLIGVDRPFLSTHNERQNQTYDTARHVFREGWAGIVTPKASFSLPGYEALPFTVTEIEVPFYGILGWPFAAVFGHDRAVVRLVATVFALVAIWLVYRIGRWWLPAAEALAGAAIFATAPLLLQFGQVPMPDILCTTGMLGAFWFALRNRLVGSSLCFVFAVLAKCNVIFFGLPILCALLLARQCKSIGEIVRASLLWGLPPLCSLIGWCVLTRVSSPDTPWTIWKTFSQRGDAHVLLHPYFYLFVIGCLFVLGIGIVGALAFFCMTRRKSSPMDSRIKWCIIASTVLYVAVVVQKILEPQYFLLPLAWLSIAAGFGMEPLLAWGWRSRARKAFLAAALALHVVVIAAGATELKCSRVRNFDEIQQAASMIPPGVRVIAAYRFYGGSAAVWLNRSVYVVHYVGELESQWPALQRLGFTHVVILDVEHRYDMQSPLQSGVAAVLRVISGSQKPATETSKQADKEADIRRYCDQTFTKLFQGREVGLYRLPVNGLSKETN